MTRDKIDYSHGDAGSKPADGNEFAAGERPDAQTFDWFWNRVTTVINKIWDEFDRLDSDDDGIVDEADTANLYKGKDIDSNGDGVVDTADYANDADASTYKGNDIDSDGDGVVNKSNLSTDTEQIDGHETYVQSTEPSSPNSGDLWIDTS